MESRKKILMGFYYGLGDFVSALPLIRYLSKAPNYELVVLISKRNKELLPLVDVEVPRVKFLEFSLFSFRSNLRFHLKFLKNLIGVRPDVVLVSPHAQDHLTSWKIPLLLKMLKFFNKNIFVIGSWKDKNSFLYDKRIPIDKSLPLMKREIVFAKLAGLIDWDVEVDIKNIFKVPHVDRKCIVTIHPGASKALKKWNDKYYFELCRELLKIKPELAIRFVGLPIELDPIKKMCGGLRNVFFVSKPLLDTVFEILDSSVVVTVDSGFSHVASALGIPHLVIFGATDPKHYSPIYPNTAFVFHKLLECQPCNVHKCKMDRNYCMDLITPQDVIKKLFEMKILQ